MVCKYLIVCGNAIQTNAFRIKLLEISIWVHCLVNTTINFNKYKNIYFHSWQPYTENYNHILKVWILKRSFLLITNIFIFFSFYLKISVVGYPVIKIIATFFKYISFNTITIVARKKIPENSIMAKFWDFNLFSYKKKHVRWQLYLKSAI